MPGASTNRWDSIEPPAPGTWSPRQSAVVIIPYYEALDALRLTLIGLSGQTYPRELFELVVVDDGSAEPLEASVLSDLADVSVVTMRDEGFRLARARNAGASVSESDTLVFLDCDMIPDPGWLEGHMRWHHVTHEALVLGFRDHIDTSWLTEALVRDAISSGGIGSLTEGRTVERPEWIEFHMTRTRDLTSSDDDVFRVVTGGNMSMSRDLYESIGGFDSSFTRWGGEDTELGYRAWIEGALLIPERLAHCWHQGLGTTPDSGEREEQLLQAKRLAHLIPHPAFRPASPGRQWQRPQIVAEVGNGPIDDMAGSIEALLAVPDLEITIAPPHDPALIEDFGPDARVHLLDPGANWSPFSPFRCRVPASVAPTKETLEHLAAQARTTGRAVTPDGVEMLSVRHAARDQLTEETFDVTSPTVTKPSSASRAISRMRRIRSWSDAQAAARWLSASARRRVSRDRAKSHSPVRELTPDPWARVLAPGYDALPASGAPAGRIDLIVGTVGQGNAPRVIPEGLDHSELLLYPPIERGEALRALSKGDPGQKPLQRMLAGVRPGDKPPGDRTGRAWDLISSDMTEFELEEARRLLLMEHLPAARLDQLRRAVELPSLMPLVTVILSTRRPERAGLAIERIRSQTYSQIELVVVDHGTQDSEIGDLVADFPQPSRLVSIERTVPFGAALEAGTRLAAGDLIAKIDDDDMYAATHIEDLVLAWLVSEADIVGKAAEFVWLEQQQKLIRRFVGGAYSTSTTIAGGAMAITRAAHDRIGGWRPLPRHVDQALIEDVVTSGGTSFRTHGLGYVLVRHGDHTWETDDQRFVDQAEQSWEEIPDWVMSSSNDSGDR